MSSTNVPGPRLGARLRHAREQRQLSLGDVSDRTGLSKGFLSRIERDMTSPSVASLVAVCEAISLPMERLFAAPSVTLVRATDRPTAIFPGAAVVDTLITPSHEPHVTVLETLAPPGGSGGAELYTMPSECEVCYVLEGEIELEVDGDVFALGRGDAVTFGATVPHTWRNTSSETDARIVWVIAPALPDPRSKGGAP
ncbi:MAG TPA: cupin domain-containing protein [Gaiellales bacterium]|nr:cupin domain-containing protein [Gaiellales bacterium]